MLSIALCRHHRTQRRPHNEGGPQWEGGQGEEAGGQGGRGGRGGGQIGWDEHREMGSREERVKRPEVERKG